MRTKPHHKHRILWAIITTVVIFIIFALIAPTFMNLNSMRQSIESAIVSQIGVPVKVQGDITFGIFGKTTINAHNVSTPYGRIKNVSMRIPFAGIFNKNRIKLDGTILISGANIHFDSLARANQQQDIYINDSVINFMGKDYSVINGVFQKGTFTGLIRTGQHKYDIKFHNREFTITNKNLDLLIHGELYASGAAAGTLEINTDKINSWFEFDVPPIKQKVKLVTDFWWDGEYGFKFYNLVANTVHGSIDIAPNGRRTISLSSDGIDFDFSFLAREPKLLQNIQLQLDFTGNLTFENKTFHRVKIDALGTEQYIQIYKIIADGTSFTGGTIDANGAHDIMIETKINNHKTTCLFSGTPEKWECAKFTYGNLFGTIIKDKKNIFGEITSNKEIDISKLQSEISRFNIQNMEIKFKFKNMAGKYIIQNKQPQIEYDYVYGKSLNWLYPHLHILPDFMMNAPGKMFWNGDTMVFTPYSGEWSLTLQQDFFYLTGQNIKMLFPEIDLRPIKDMNFSVSGYYNAPGDISNLNVKIANHIFAGSIDSNGITLSTNVLELSAFLDKNFLSRYDEMEFLINEPILLPFNLDKRVYLRANTLIYNENIYKNFVYSLKSDTQTFSISDNSRGNMLATIVKQRAAYDVFIQLNKFMINGKLLNSRFPLNIMDTSVTAELHLQTSGHIAHDIWYNMNGTLDLTFDGGYILGLGLDDFYAAADTLTRLNLESRLMTALESGTTRIKTMRIIGEYNNGDFATTEPIKISMRHADAIGIMQIVNDIMTAKLNITMRATAPNPVKVSVSVAPNGARSYSISEIMRYFDPIFMRNFIKTHDKF